MVHFKLDIDADGIALVTWDSPGRSMNVIDLKVMEELGSHRSSKVAGDAAIKGAVITSGKDTFCAGADLTMLDMLSREFTDIMREQGEEMGMHAALRGGPQAVAALSAARNLRQAVGRGDQRHDAGRRLRTVPRLPPPRRLRQSEIARRPARDQDRAVPRRRRHAAHRAHDACPATRCSSCSRATRSGLAQAKGMKIVDAVVPAGELIDAAKKWIKDGGKADESVGRRRLPAAGRARLFQGRHDDVPAGERDLPPRDLRQLSGRARDHADGLRGPAASDRSGAAGRVALVREDPAHAGSGGDDPLAVRLDAGAQQGRAPARRTCRRRNSRRSASSAPASWAPASATSRRSPASRWC